MGDLSQMDPGDDLSWGQLAEAYDTLVTIYEQLEPPEELRDYHDAWLANAAALRDYAESRPATSSFLGDILTLMFETLMPSSMSIALDPTKTDEEKQELIEGTARDAFGEFFGPDVVASGTAFEEAQEALSAETLALLEQSDCYFGISPISSLEDGIGLGPDPSFEDDHSDTRDGATSINVGETVEGMVDYEGDFDFFRFDAQQGKVLKIDVELGLEADWTIALYDSAGSQLDLAITAPIFWEAPDISVYYVELNVWTAETGPYALTVSIVEDDHGNSAENSTRIVVGESIEGSLDYNTDLDYFMFPAEEGTSYTITTEPGALPHPQLALYDINLVLQDFGTGPNDPIEWQAPSTEDYYIEAAAFGETGTYTLSLTSTDGS